MPFMTPYNQMTPVFWAAPDTTTQAYGHTSAIRHASLSYCPVCGAICMEYEPHLARRVVLPWVEESTPNCLVSSCLCVVLSASCVCAPTWLSQHVCTHPARLSPDRFDLLHVMLDELTEEDDGRIAAHIVALHKDPAATIGRAPFTMEQLQRFIKFARAIKPRITTEVRSAAHDESCRSPAAVAAQTSGRQPQNSC